MRAGAAVRLASPSTAGPHGAVRSRTRTCTYVFGCRRACVGVCGHVPACPWVSRARASVRRSASLYGSLRASAGRLGREERWVPHLGVTCAGPSGCAPASRPLPGKAGTSRGNPEPLYGTSVAAVHARGVTASERVGRSVRFPAPFSSRALALADAGRERRPPGQQDERVGKGVSAERRPSSALPAETDSPAGLHGFPLRPEVPGRGCPHPGRGDSESPAVSSR